MSASLATAEDVSGPRHEQALSSLVPQGWRYVRLTSVAKLESGHTPSRRKPSYWNGDIPWVSLLDTGGLNGAVISATRNFVTREGIANSSARLLPAGTVIFSRTATVGKSTVMGREMATSQDFANYICGPEVHNHFLVYLFRHMAPEWRKLMAGSIHNTVYMPVFRVLQVLLPSFSEQVAIAKALSDIDALIESLEQLLAKKRQIKQGAMQELLTGQRRLPGSEGENLKTFLGKLGSCHRGVAYNPTADLSVGDTPQSVRLLRSNNVQGSTIQLDGLQYVNDRCVSVQQVLREDDVVICTANGSRDLVGKAARFSIDDGQRYTFGAFMGCYRPAIDKIDPVFAHYLFQTNEYRSQIGIFLAGSSINNLSPSAIEATEVCVPPTRAEQTAIAATLSDMDAELTALEARLAKTRLLKQGMAQALLTGRIRLV